MFNVHEKALYLEYLRRQSNEKVAASMARGELLRNSHQTPRRSIWMAIQDFCRARLTRFVGKAQPVTKDIYAVRRDRAA